jgi:hypothetical protein
VPVGHVGAPLVPDVPDELAQRVPLSACCGAAVTTAGVLNRHELVDPSEMFDWSLSSVVGSWTHFRVATVCLKPLVPSNNCSRDYSA